MSAAAVLDAVQDDPYLLATKDVKDDYLTDDWERITIITLYVEEIAKFAVKEHNKKAKDDLKYKSVKCGWTMEKIDKTLYRLILVATSDKLPRPHEREYEAIVSVTKTIPPCKKLEYFKPYNEI